MSYSILMIKSINEMLLVSEDIDANSQEDQDYFVVNGAWGGTFKKGQIYYNYKWQDVQVFNNIEYNGDYNEPIWKLKEELGL